MQDICQEFSKISRLTLPYRYTVFDRDVFKLVPRAFHRGETLKYIAQFPKLSDSNPHLVVEQFEKRYYAFNLIRDLDDIRKLLFVEESYAKELSLIKLVQLLLDVGPSTSHNYLSLNHAMRPPDTKRVIIDTLAPQMAYITQNTHFGLKQHKNMLFKFIHYSLNLTTEEFLAKTKINKRKHKEIEAVPETLLNPTEPLWYRT